MANNLKASALIGNIWAGTSTIKPVRHSVPAFVDSIADLESVAVEVTGTGDYLLSLDTLRWDLDGGGYAKNPLTGATLESSSTKGFAVSVGRAADATAPTGAGELSLLGICGGVTSTAIPFGEGAFFFFHNPAAGVDGATDGLTVDLTGTTGYKVSVVVYFDPA